MSDQESETGATQPDTEETEAETTEGASGADDEGATQGDDAAAE